MASDRETAWRPTTREMQYLLSHPMLSSSITARGDYSFQRSRGRDNVTGLDFAIEDGAAYLTFDVLKQPEKKWATRDECYRALLGDHET